MSGKIVTISAKAIVVSGLQVREQMDRKHVDEIAELFDEENPTWPDGLPPVVVFHDGKSHFLADGHHRIDAAVQSGCTEIRVEIRKGTREDALKYACGANASHGLKRTNADKRNAVKIAYQLNPGNTDRAIAKICKVSSPFASSVLRELQSRPKNQEKQAAASGKKGANVSTPETDEQGANVSTPETSEASRGGGLSIDDVTEEGRNVEGESEPAAPISIPAPVSPFAVADSFFDEADKLIVQLGKAIAELGTLRGAELLRTHYLKLKDGEKLYSPDLENLRRELKHWRPHSPRCPVCNGTPSQHCNLCFGLPYLTRGAYDRLTEEQRRKLEKVQGNDAA